MSYFRMTQEAFDAHQAQVKGARVVKRMDGDPEQKQATKANRAKKAERAKLEIPQFVPETVKAPRKKWDYEQRLAQQLEAAGITGFYVDAEYLPNRQLRADILFIRERLVIEIQGAVHRTKAKWQADIFKAQDTMLGGFRLLPIATGQVRDGAAVEIIRKALERLGGVCE